MKKYMIETIQRYRKRVYYYSDSELEALRQFLENDKPIEQDEDYLESHIVKTIVCQVNEDNQYI